LEHTPRTLVEKVDFISAPGFSDDNVYRPGGPHKLITDRCLFDVDKERKCFRLESVHPGHTVDEIHEQTGFKFDLPDGTVPETRIPNSETLHIIRGEVASEISEIYPAFAARVFGIVNKS
jgi:glutaconate CoA-transferase subunit B